jgi:hypothetical protein
MLVSADIGVWAIFIIISVVAQIVKARKKAANQEPKQPSSERSDQAPARPDEELRQFLEKLAGGRPQRTAPAEVNIPPEVVRARRPPAPPQLPTQPKRQRTQAPQTIPTVSARPTATPPTVRVTPAVALEPVVTTDATALRILLRKELQQADATRKAMVLHEILGPPIGLRARERRG